MNEDYKTKDYSYLEGKTIKYIYDIDGYNEEFEAVVSGCDYNIGISIEVVSDKEKEHVKIFFEDENSDQYLYCLPGPSLKDHMFLDLYRNGNYDTAFQRLITLIDNGVIKGSFDNDLYNHNNVGIMTECPFK